MLEYQVGHKAIEYDPTPSEAGLVAIENTPYQDPMTIENIIDRGIEAISSRPEWHNFTWWDKVVRLESDLDQTPAVTRLKKLHQLGTLLFMDKSWKPMGTVQDRFIHTKVVSALVKMAHIRLQSSEEETLAAVMAAKCHDLGHSILSHTGDELLIEMGLPNHEQRSQTLVESDHALKMIGDRHAVNLKLVQSIMREEGGLGMIQKVMDTAGYLWVDLGEFRADNGIHYGAYLINDMVAIRDNKLVVKTPEIWQEFLELRAKTMQEYYYNLPNRMNRAAIKELLLYALKYSDITGASEDKIRTGTDQNLWEMVNHFEPITVASSPKGIPRLPQLYNLALGQYDPSAWASEYHPTLESANHARVRLAPEQVQQSFILKPHGYTKKSLTLYTENPDGSLKEVRLSPQRIKDRPEDHAHILVHVK